MYESARDARLAGRLDEAIGRYREVLRHDPGHARAHNGLAHALRHAGRISEAIPHAERAVELDAYRIDTWINLGNAYREAGRIHDALNACDRALCLDPGRAESRWNRGLALLALGRFREGWIDYESRFEGGTREQRPYRHEQLPANLPRGFTVLAWAEQGVGEEVLFSSCLPDLKATGVRVAVECGTRLAPLFARSFPAMHVHGAPRDGETHWLEEIEPIHCQLPMGSLPRYFRNDLADFCGRDSWLVAEPDAVNAWRQRLRGLGGRLAVGISWRGGRQPRVRARRSIGLDAWRPIFAVAGVTFVNLQYGPRAKEATPQATAGARVHHWPEPDPLVDLDGFAALVTALDLVVTVDNATANLAGALGVPARVMLPVNADWRWLHEGSDTPWFPSCRLHRQRAPGEWSEVVESVAAALAEDVARGRA